MPQGPGTIEEITWDSNGKPEVKKIASMTRGCTGATFESEAIRIVGSGNYEHIRLPVFGDLLERVGRSYGAV